MPCAGILRPSGYSPLVNSGMVWSQYLNFDSGIACRMFRPIKYRIYTRLMSAQSIAVDCDRKRFSRSAFSEACICTVKPRSLVACSAMAGMAVTGGPAWCRTTSLMVCAQIVGEPAYDVRPDGCAGDRGGALE